MVSTMLMLKDMLCKWADPGACAAKDLVAEGQRSLQGGGYLTFGGQSAQLCTSLTSPLSIPKEVTGCDEVRVPTRDQRNVGASPTACQTITSTKQLQSAYYLMARVAYHRLLQRSELECVC